MRKLSHKLLTSLVLIIFATSGNVYSQQTPPIEEPIAKTDQEVGIKPAGSGEGAMSKAPSSVTKNLNPYNIVIPEEYGSIEEVFQGSPDSPLVVHIQDAHANYEAQVNIKKILGHLSKNYRFDLIQLEGASSKLNPSVFETAYIKEANVKLADYLMREGRLSGAEAFAIESESPVELEGIENRLLYIENFKTFRSVYSHQNEINEYFKAMRILSKDLRIKLLNEELLDLTRKMEAYAGEKMDLLDYLLFLNQLAEKYKIASLKNLTEIVRFPNLVRIMRLHQLEESLDEKALQKESEALKKLFREKNSSPAVMELLSKLEMKKKGMKPRVYFKKIASLATKNGIDLLAYPQLRTLAEFLILQDEIEHHGLFREVHRLEKLLQKNLLKKKEERDLIELLRSLDFLEQYFKLELNREKLAFIMKRYEKMKPSTVKARLDSLAQQFGVLPSDYASDTKKLDEYMNEVEYFYRVVLERDGLFVKNVLTKMKESSKDQTVLITGGFHTDGVTSLMRKQNLSYVVVIPKVDVKQGNETYLKIMLEGDSAVGSVFAGTFALEMPILSVNPFEHVGAAGPYLSTLRLIAHLGAGLAFYQSVQTTGQIPELTEQKEVTQRFNRAQPFLNVAPQRVQRNPDGTISTFQVDRVLVNGKIIETNFEIKVSEKEFSIRPISSRELKGREARPFNLQNPGINEPVSQRVNVPSLFERAKDLVARVFRRQTRPEDLQKALKNALSVYPGIMVLDQVPQQDIIDILAGMQDNLPALVHLQRNLREGKPVTADELRRIQALTQPGRRAVSIEDVQNGVPNEQRQARLTALLGVSPKPGVAKQVKPRILMVPSLEATPRDGREAQLLSVVETLRGNEAAGAVIFGKEIKTFAMTVLGIAEEQAFERALEQDNVLRRIQFVDVRNDKEALSGIAIDLRTGKHVYNKLYLKFVPEFTGGKRLTSPSALKDTGIIRVLLPEGAEGVEKLSAELSIQSKNIVQFSSPILKVDRRDLNLVEAVATIQIKALNILPNPQRPEELEEFTTLLTQNDLSGIIQGGGNQWKFVAIAELVKQLFVDYLAAREIAIKA